MAYELSLLRASGLPLDWQTIYVGWQGVTENWYPSIKVTHAAVRALAFDVLADFVGSSDEDAVFHIADSEQSWWDFYRFLFELAERSGVSRETALRKWRYAVAFRVLNNEPLLNDEEDCWEEWETLYRLSWEWQELLPDHPIPSVEVSSTPAELARERQRLRNWLEGERRALTEETGGTLF